MHGITRKLTVAFAAIAMSAGLASQASAATTTVRLHTQADTSKYLTDGAGGLAQMLKSNSSDPAQRFRKTDTNSGYATYTSVKSLSGVTPRCLTGRGLQGFPVVTVETLRLRRAQPAVAARRQRRAAAAPQRARRVAQHGRQRLGRSDGIPAAGRGQHEVAHPPGLTR